MHHVSKGSVQTANIQFPQGPKVITQPAQGPPVALAQISGLTAVTTQKMTGHQVQHSHTISRQSNNTVNSVGRANVSGTSIPMAKVLPQLTSTSGLNSSAVHGSNASVTSVGGISHQNSASQGQTVEQSVSHSGVYRTAHTG